MHSVACARFDYYKKEPVNRGVLRAHIETLWVKQEKFKVFK